MRNLLLAALCAAALAACSTTHVGLKYTAYSSVGKVSPATAPVAIGEFLDQRGEPARWLGAIRGGFGNPLKNLESDQPVASLVRAAFAEGLRARGVKLERADSPNRIHGVIRRLDCNQMVRREAHAVIELVVTDVAGAKERFRRTYAVHIVDGPVMSVATGVFATVEDLRIVTEYTLREVVDKALDDGALRDALMKG